jgi:hypothetical protein
VKEAVPYCDVLIYTITGDCREGSTRKKLLKEGFREVGISATIVDPETVNFSITQKYVSPFISKFA